MQDPKSVNLTPTEKIKAAGWVAEARDSDGHLYSTQAWLDRLPHNENLRMLGEFIADYDGEGGTTVTVFTDTLLAKLSA